MINVAIFDMDGTLTSKDNNEIPVSTLESLNQLKKQNIKIIVATGRPLYGFDKNVMKKIGADAYVLNNGRIVMDDKNQKLFDEPIDSDFLNKTINIINDLNLDYGLHLENETLVLRGTSIQNVIKKITSKIDHVRKTSKLPEHLKAYNIMVRIPNKEIIDLFKENIPNCIVEEFSPEFYDIYPNNKDKSVGIKFLLTKFRTNWSNTIAFGDGLNDECYLSKSANAFCMADGHDDLKNIKGIEIAPASKDLGIEKILIKKGLIEFNNHAHGWVRFKHRFIMTNLRYTLPISFFLLLFFVYDFLISNLNTISYSNLILSFIFLGMSFNLYSKE